ncbi:MAG: hypothetical protein Q7W29_04825 [bacterium]|nr:hypothetical protein [bacterium]
MERRLPIGSIVVALVILNVAAASATETLMDRLPLNARFSCLNCHTVAAPTSATAALNPFGAAFRDGGSVWDNALAVQDSDGDGCTNGAEVGDIDGNGQIDGGVTEESSNPGDEDCSASILDEKTWGQLKAMFNGR